MRVRPYTRADKQAILALRELHGPGYFFPDPDEPLQSIGTLIVEDDDGRIVGAMIGRVVVEPFLLVNPQRSTATKWGAIKALIGNALRLAHRNGFKESIVSVPKELGRYADLLKRLPHMHPDDRIHLVADIDRACAAPESGPSVWAKL